MSGNPSEENPKNKDSRFYEPRNWDKAMRIEGNSNNETIYCGRCGHIIYRGDRFCTKCGAESREKKKT